jgi:pimeloyl-ACP methyl ester carboxylesterase
MGAQVLAQSVADYAKSTVAMAAGMVTAPADQARVRAWATASNRAVMVKAMQEDMTTDLRPRMAGLKVPVTVIYEAPLGPLVQGDYAAAPQKTLVAAAPGAKHFLMYDDLAGFDAALDGFLAK